MSDLLIQGTEARELPSLTPKDENARPPLPAALVG
jgi:hypothetical protein